jgi:ketosteroid isomerase-like protein
VLEQSTLENTMQKTDYDQMQQLMAIYAHAIDAKNYDVLTTCFTPDATTTYVGYSLTLTGHAEIIAHMRRALDPLDATQHLFTNFVVNVDDNVGDLTCDILAQHVHQGKRYLAGGKYNVSVRQIDGKWKIVCINARNVWSDGDRAMLPKPA